MLAPPPAAEAGEPAGDRIALRGVWVIGPRARHAPYSKRFRTVEGRWRAALAARLEAGDASPFALDVAGGRFPSDREVVEAFRRSEGASDPLRGITGRGRPGAGAGGNRHLHLLTRTVRLLPGPLPLWPMVAVERGDYCAAVLPLVAPARFVEAVAAPSGGPGAAGGPGGLREGSALACQLAAACEVAEALASFFPAPGDLLAAEEVRALAEFVQGALPFGVPNDTDPQRVLALQRLHNTEFGDGLPYWKPFANFERAELALEIREEVGGAISSEGQGTVFRVAGSVRCAAAIPEKEPVRGAFSAQAGRPVDRLNLLFHHCVADVGPAPDGAALAVTFAPPAAPFLLATYTPDGGGELPLLGALKFGVSKETRKSTFELQLRLAGRLQGTLRRCRALVRFPARLTVKSCFVAACSTGQAETFLDEATGEYCLEWTLDHRLNNQSPRAVVAGAFVGVPPPGESVGALLAGPNGVLSAVHFSIAGMNSCALHFDVEEQCLKALKLDREFHPDHNVTYLFETAAEGVKLFPSCTEVFAE